MSRKHSSHEKIRLLGRDLPKSELVTEPPREKCSTVVGQSKSDDLCSDPSCSNVVAFTVFYEKPLCFLSTAVEKLIW